MKNQQKFVDRTLIALFSICFVSLSILSCKTEKEQPGKKYDASKPVVLKSFYPNEGGARDKILLDGENFGTDPDKIKVYFNKAKASVVSSSGDRIYAIIPRLPGANPRISVVVGKDSVTYENVFAYHTQAQVSTVTGNGQQAFKPGKLSEAEVYGKYLELDSEGNIFMSWRDGGTFGVARINERENIVTPLIESPATGRILYANGLTVDRASGMLTAAHESTKEVIFTFDPREAWYPRQRNVKYSPSDLSSIIDADRYKNFVTFCPYDGHLYTRYRDGKIAKINPETMEAKIVHQGPYGSQYGQAINPAKPWLLYITLHSNARPTEFRQGISVLDLRDPNGSGGFKRLNAPGGSGFRDGPLADALFNYPKDIKFDNDGNMFVADYGNHCIRMVSADNIVTTVAGQPGTAGYKDGGPVESLFNEPWGVAVNEQGDIYIADWSNARIRKLVIE
ncbi:IPT/TIG domain-containing protein [Desertivirga xinjiangensis]|uniref:IPT/TIG domain-containing protein n=1 Tax=Desertivirga xinjiangensis TaxID=539206 RepID=UPI00210D6DA1|nr:IPT/TIG domain-containing protein [Pedobacter xinjiangensis]